jgi:hypothetical protein
VKARGRPVLGAISGLFLGAFVALDLQQFAVRPLDNLSVIGLPLIGLALGLALGIWGPIGRKRAGEPAAPATTARGEPPAAPPPA